MKVGIEAISFDIPQYYLEMDVLATARVVEPAKYITGLGQRQMSVSSPCEDTVVLGATAGLRLINDFGIDKNSISLLISGTETGVDHSKPVASYLHEIMGLSSSCQVFEVKHACYGAMAGLTMAVNYILSGKAKGKKALIIATDIARYGKNTPGEPTQGAGSVAILVSDNPKLLEIDYQYEGYFAQQVMDFWRPLYSKEAFADGHYSIQCYLDALSGAYSMYKASALNENSLTSSNVFSSQFDACLYHVPFAKMAFKAHQRLLEHDAGLTFEKGTEAWTNMLADYEQRVAPSLEFNSRIGNIYTGALFLGLAYLMGSAAHELAGKSISLFSYGSGCGAEFMSGKIAPTAADVMENCTAYQLLDTRQALTIERYEEMLDACGKMDLNNEQQVCSPDYWQLTRPILYLGVKDHKRIYSAFGKIVGQ